MLYIILGYCWCDIFVLNVHAERELLSKNVKTEKYKTIILPVALFKHDTWSLTTREKRRLRVFEDVVLPSFLVRRNSASARPLWSHTSITSYIRGYPNVTSQVHDLVHFFLMLAFEIAFHHCNILRITIPTFAP
jgi:hypothetical protein